jgi:hypothetical protein
MQYARQKMQICQPKYKTRYKKIILDTSKLMHFLSLCHIFVIIRPTFSFRYVDYAHKLLLNKEYS